MCLQVIRFTICYMNLDCQVASLSYYDGDIRETPHQYCGLRQLTLPISNTSVAILKTPYYHDADFYELKVHYSAVVKDGIETGKPYVAQALERCWNIPLKCRMGGACVCVCVHVCVCSCSRDFYFGVQ